MLLLTFFALPISSSLLEGNSDQAPDVENSAQIEKENLVVPEKASSFKFHPERVCYDVCFYCGGKFGMYDTPLHIAQIKKLERKNKILLGKMQNIIF